MADIHQLRSEEQLREQACEWIGRLNAHNVSAEDTARFEAWRAAHPRNADAYAKVAMVWRGMVKTGELVRAVGVGQQFNAITERAIHRARAARARGRHIALATAATVVAALGAGWWAHTRTDDTLFRTAIGERATVKLPDGSSLELNSNSQARIVYTAQARVVKLERGEAYFDVEPDSRRPFWVAAGKSWVGAVGTAFNVDVRTSEVQVTVSEGAVKVAPNVESPMPPSADSGQTPISAVKAGQQLDVRGGATEVRSLEPAQLTRSLAWRTGFIVFKDERLEDVVKELNRYTKLKIVIGDERLRKLGIGGTFETNEEGAEALLANLEEGFGLKVRRDGRAASVE
jgi:transmembrane sensor